MNHSVTSLSVSLHFRVMNDLNSATIPFELDFRGRLRGQWLCQADNTRVVVKIRGTVRRVEKAYAGLIMVRWYICCLQRGAFHYFKKNYACFSWLFTTCKRDLKRKIDQFSTSNPLIARCPQSSAIYECLSESCCYSEIAAAVATTFCLFGPTIQLCPFLTM